MVDPSPYWAGREVSWVAQFADGKWELGQVAAPDPADSWGLMLINQMSERESYLSLCVCYHPPIHYTLPYHYQTPALSLFLSTTTDQGARVHWVHC